MFKHAESFDHSLNKWDIRSVTTLAEMFAYASHFNGRIGKWNLQNVESMWQMFRDAISFNQDISEWNVASVRDMNFAFEGALSFASDITGWSTTLRSSGLFRDATSWLQSYEYVGFLCCNIVKGPPSDWVRISTTTAATMATTTTTLPSTTTTTTTATTTTTSTAPPPPPAIIADRWSSNNCQGPSTRIRKQFTSIGIDPLSGTCEEAVESLITTFGCADPASVRLGGCCAMAGSTSRSIKVARCRDSDGSYAYRHRKSDTGEVDKEYMLIGCALVFGVVLVLGIIILTIRKRRRGAVSKEVDDTVV